MLLTYYSGSFPSNFSIYFLGIPQRVFRGVFISYLIKKLFGSSSWDFFRSSSRDSCKKSLRFHRSFTEYFFRNSFRNFFKNSFNTISGNFFRILGFSAKITVRDFFKSFFIEFFRQSSKTFVEIRKEIPSDFFSNETTNNPPRKFLQCLQRLFGKCLCGSARNVSWESFRESVHELFKIFLQDILQKLSRKLHINWNYFRKNF